MLWPAGKIVRALWRVPRLGPAVSQAPFHARLGWQANRLSPDEVLAAVRSQLTDVQSSDPRSAAPSASRTPPTTTFEGVHRSHWWLVATVR